MTRHKTRDGRTRPRQAPRSPWSQTAAASALAGGCLAVVALWKSAAGTGDHGSAGR